MKHRSRTPSPQGWITPKSIKRCLSPLAHLLRTGDPSSSMDRLFTSQHVKDLRLIIALSLLAVFGVVVISLASSASNNVELLKAGQYGRFSLKVVADFFTANGNFLKFCAPVIGVFGLIFAWAYQACNLRLGVVDLFACEISTLCRVALVVKTVHRYVERAKSGPPEQVPGAGGPQPQAPHSISQENYFPVFENNTGALQMLEARVVIDITAFYTYMKSVRDIQRALAEIVPQAPQSAASSALAEQGTPAAGSWMALMRNLIYMLFLALESARHSVDNLVEFEPENAERTMVILLSELEAFRFLRDEFRTDGDMYHERIVLRIPGYKETLDKLRSNIEQGLRHRTQGAEWQKAVLLLPELNRLAAAALESRLSASA